MKVIKRVAHTGLQASRPRPYRRPEAAADVALISMVGEGLLHRQGIGTRYFTAVAEERLTW
jgi:aspartokinase